MQANFSYAHPSGGSSSVQGYHDTDPITYNLIGFYEKGPIELRLAYNWRNEYVSQHNEVTLAGQPYENDLFVSAYGELDASINLHVTKQVTVFAQALNLNNERTVRYWGTTDRIGDYEGYGRRFGLGARVGF